MAAGTPRPPGRPPQSRLTAGCVTGKSEVPAGQVLEDVPGGSPAGLSRAPGRGSGREPLRRPHMRRPPEAERGVLPGSLRPCGVYCGGLTQLFCHHEAGGGCH